MTYVLDGKRWFQIASRCWRPFQQWGFAIAAVSYAFRPVLDLAFDIETFAALAAAGGVGFLGRGVEKVVKARAIAKHAPHKLTAEAVNSF